MRTPFRACRSASWRSCSRRLCGARRAGCAARKGQARHRGAGPHGAAGATRARTSRPRLQAERPRTRASSGTRESSRPSLRRQSTPMSDTPLLAKNDDNLVWIDCEMTGLDPEVDRLLEIAVIVTSPDLVVRVDGPVLVIHQSDEQLDKMDSWNKGTHGKSGLIDKVKASATTEQEAVVW